MVFLLRLFVGLLLAFWSRVAAAQTSKARRGTESPKAKKWCGLRAVKRAQPRFFVEARMVGLK